MQQQLVSDWMTRDIVTVDAQASLNEAAALMASHDIRHLPIVDGHDFLGIVTTETLRHARLVGSHNPHHAVQTVNQLSVSKTTIAADATMADAAEKLLLSRTTALAILDADGKLCGILTQSDMLYHTLLLSNPPPPPYELTLRTQEVVTIRPILPQDAIQLRALYDELSAESKYYRFLKPHNPLNARKIRPYTIADYREHMAYVVEAPQSDEIVGIAEYVPLVPPVSGSAEFSIAIADAWQGKGLGKRLLLDLMEYARSQGLQKLLGVIHAENAPMLALTEKLDVPTKRSYDGGVYEVWLYLNEIAIF